MNDHARPSGPVSDETEAPTWLAVLLRTASPETVAFRANCVEAGGAALGLLRMRRISQRMSPPLLGVPAYLRSLAAAAGVGLGPVLHWAGIDLARPSDRSFGVAWGRLALVFRLPIREALLHLRLTFADEVGQDLTPGLMMALRSGSGAVSLLDQFEASLSAAVQTWDTEMQARLQASEGELLAAYRRAATDEAG